MSDASVLDMLLAALIVLLAAGAVIAPRMRYAVILFMALGSVLALTWARLAAPDLAIAEAAIGVGLTGAMLIAALNALGKLGSQRSHVWLIVSGVGLTVMVAAVFGYALVQALGQHEGARLAEVVQSHLPASGVTNPVTAVLLNFRAYDTLLELAVLLVAVIGIRLVGKPLPMTEPGDPVLKGLASFIVPALVMVAAYLLWAGAAEPGGAFQAGALLAAAMVMLHVTGASRLVEVPAGVANVLLVVGITAFITAGLLSASITGGFLEYRPPLAGALILFIEAASTLAIAVALAIAFVGGDAHMGRRRA